jgi:hypothetical protein
MLGRGHGHADGIDPAAQLIEGREGMRAKFGGGSLRSLRVLVEDSY